jgi:adenylylsulfate kinase
MNNIHIHNHTITTEQRNTFFKHKSPVLWFTGLSGSGKSTVANHLESILFDNGVKTFILDGDNIRSGLNSDLGFSDDDRVENIRRISHVSKLFSDSGVIPIVSFISPFTEERLKAKKIIGEDNFIEVYFSTPIDVCEKRDPKKLYEKARMGLIKNFTGIDSLYEEPSNPDIIIDTINTSIDDCAEQIINHLKEKNFI